MNQMEWDRMMDQKLYNPFGVDDGSFERVHAAQRRFNASDDLNDKEAFEALKACFAEAPDDMILLAPVYFDHGDRIRFGRHFLPIRVLPSWMNITLPLATTSFWRLMSVFIRQGTPSMLKCVIPTSNMPDP